MVVQRLVYARFEYAYFFFFFVLNNLFALVWMCVVVDVNVFYRTLHRRVDVFKAYGQNKKKKTQPKRNKWWNLMGWNRPNFHIIFQIKIYLHFLVLFFEKIFRRKTNVVDSRSGKSPIWNYCLMDFVTSQWNYYENSVW